MSKKLHYAILLAVVFVLGYSFNCQEDSNRWIGVSLPVVASIFGTRIIEVTLPRERIQRLENAFNAKSAGRK